MPVNIPFRHTPEYHAWIHDLARHLGYYTVADLLRDILHQRAERAGFRPPPGGEE